MAEQKQCKEPTSKGVVVVSENDLDQASGGTSFDYFKVPTFPTRKQGSDRSITAGTGGNGI